MKSALGYSLPETAPVLPTLSKILMQTPMKNSALLETFSHGRKASNIKYQNDT
jgi:hypothetical protein